MGTSHIPVSLTINFKKLYAKMCPLGRMLKPKEVFEPVWFLCSNRSSGATGHNLIIDGGRSVW